MCRYPEPSILASLVAYLALNVRQFMLRYLTLPRFFPLTFFSEEDGATGRIQHFDYLLDPYYQKPTVWNRWGPMAVAKWAMGIKLPGTSASLLPQGFLWEDIGPTARMGKGKEQMAEWEKHLKSARNSGCPFAC
jgi:hypothetical protein